MARIAILVEKIYEDLELQYPKYRLREAGHHVDVVGPVANETFIGKHGYPQRSEMAAAEVQIEDYQLVVIPGGTSPDHMRRSGDMIKLAQSAVAHNVPIAAICHGPWLLCSTTGLRGKRCTSYMSIAHDVINAGGEWVDEACVVDGNIITARTPDDLPPFMQALLEILDGKTPTGTKGKPIAPDWVMQLRP